MAARVGSVASIQPLCDAFKASKTCLSRNLPSPLSPSMRFAQRGRRADAILWLAYPKLTSKLAGDLSRDVIHEWAPSHGLDTVSQIAIDADWSALRLKRI